MKTKSLLLTLPLLSLVGWSSYSSSNPAIGSASWYKQEINAIQSQANNISTDALKAGLTAYIKARQSGTSQKQVLTIIDYSKPSTKRRLWVIDVKNEKVLFNTWVSHGKNSGEVNATSFSNQPGSLKSSFGVFKTTSETYMGHNGYSLRLKGLEQGINDKAYERAIVIHGAWYATEEVAQRYGTLGRSWGCPAISKEIAKPLINTIKDGTVVVAYYPNQKWLRNSTFLAG